MVFVRSVLKVLGISLGVGVVGFVLSICFFGLMVGTWNVEFIDVIVMCVFVSISLYVFIPRELQVYRMNLEKEEYDQFVMSNVDRLNRHLGTIFNKYKERGLNRFPDPVRSNQVYVTNKDAFLKLDSQVNRLADRKLAFDRLEGKSWDGRLGSKKFMQEDVLTENLEKYDVSGFVSMMLSHDGNYFDRFNDVKYAWDSIHERHKGLGLGLDGERLVESEVSKYIDESRSLYGNRFQTDDDGTVENDVLVFGKSGIYSIEVKNILSEGDKYLKISKDGLWYVKTSENASWNLNNKYSDIFKQVNRHIYHTEKVLSDVVGRDVEVKSVIVIANNSVVIENESEWDIVRPNTLYMKIKETLDRSLYSESELDDMVRFMKSIDLGEGKFLLEDFSDSIDHMINWIDYYTMFVEMTKEMFDLYNNEHEIYK